VGVCVLEVIEMETYTIEQQGMLKMLERLYQLLKNGRSITWGNIAYEIGLEAKYWRKLIDGRIIENTNNSKKPRYHWISILPNIYMAIETLKTDLPDYSNENILKGFTKSLENEQKIQNIIKKENNIINIPFSDFWNLYDKKVGDKDKIEISWNKLSYKNRVLIMEYLPKYIQARPDKLYRKNPNSFINQKSWLDEIITKTFVKSNNQFESYPMSKYSDKQLWDELISRGYIIDNNQIVKKLS
jgi:hypothetical protein